MLLRSIERKARQMLDSGQAESAAELLRRAISNGGSRTLLARYTNLLAVCEAHLGRFEEARKLFYQVLTIRPGDCAALTNLGNLSFIQDRLHEAREFYERALRRNALAAEPWLNLALTYQYMGHFEKAMSALSDYDMIVRAAKWLKAAAILVAVAVGLLSLIIAFL